MQSAQQHCHFSPFSNNLGFALSVATDVGAKQPDSWRTKRTAGVRSECENYDLQFWDICIRKPRVSDYLRPRDLARL